MSSFSKVPLKSLHVAAGFALLLSALLFCVPAALGQGMPQYEELSAEHSKDAAGEIGSTDILELDGCTRVGNKVLLPNGTTVSPSSDGLHIQLPDFSLLKIPLYLSEKSSVLFTSQITGNVKYLVGREELASDITLTDEFITLVEHGASLFWIFPDGRILTPSGILIFPEGPQGLRSTSPGEFFDISQLTGIPIHLTNDIASSSVGLFSGGYLNQPFFDSHESGDNHHTDIDICDEGPECCCPNGANKKAKTLIITVHGVNSDGDEWTDALKRLRESKCIEVVEFKYNDWRCLGNLVKDLKKFVLSYKEAGKWCKVVVLAHSAGGLLASRLASDNQAAPDETHTMATPLKGGNYGPPVWLARPFIGCLKAQIGHGLDKHPEKKKGTKVTHHKTGDNDEAVENRWMKGSQDGNEVPGSTSVDYPDDDHTSIINTVVKNLLKDGVLPDCE